MEEVTKLEFLPLMATRVAEWFPRLGGRCAAVSDAKVTPENRPTLPFALVALNREQGRLFDVRRTEGGATLEQDFIIEFWLPIKRFAPWVDKQPDETKETPFWSYYPVEDIRDRLLTNILRESQRKGNEDWGIAYTSMDIDADPQAVVLTFRFLRTYIWCPLDHEDDEEIPLVLSFGTCPSVC